MDREQLIKRVARAELTWAEQRDMPIWKRGRFRNRLVTGEEAWQTMLDWARNLPNDELEHRAKVHGIKQPAPTADARVEQG